MATAHIVLETARRQTVRAVALTLVASTTLIGLGVLVVFFITPNVGFGVLLAGLVVALAGNGATLVMLRTWPLNLAALPLAVAIIVTELLVSAVIPEIKSSAIPFFAVVVLLVSLSSDLRFTIGTGLICALLSLLIFIIELPSAWTFNLGAALLPIQIALTIAFILVICGVAWSLISSQDMAIDIADKRTAEAEHARSEVEATRNQLEERNREQQKLLDLVQVLELPILEVGDNILVVPLIGWLDSNRSEAIQQRLLEAIARQHTQTVVLDITGINTIDTAVAHILITMAQSVRLLGAHMLVSGISPNVAQTLVELDVKLAGIQPIANLGEALTLAQQRQN